MNLLFYKANADYCDFLREKDKCVPYTREDKSERPFLGIVLNVNGYNYYAPLSSPKPKHVKMNNQLDFTKIDNGKLGAINFNNMIPIHINLLEKVNLNLLPTDTKADIFYKNLLDKQLSWCNKNKQILNKKAAMLYHIITKGTPNLQLRNRCCNFKVDELQYEKYCELNNLKIINYNGKVNNFKKELKEHGFLPTTEIMAQYSQLCKISDLTLNDISMAYHGKINVSNNLNALVTQIGNELKNQEISFIKDANNKIPDR